MLYTAADQFDAEAAFKDFLNQPDSPVAWRRAASLSPFHSWLMLGFGGAPEDLAFIRTILDQGMDPGDVRDLDSFPLIHEAARRNLGPLVTMLAQGMMARRVHPLDLTEGIHGNTPLHEAALHGSFESLTALLALGANASVLTHDRSTPLYNWIRASERKPGERLAGTHALLDAGAPINAKTKRGGTALHAAVAVNDMDTLNVLLQRGANVKLVNAEKETPQDLAQRLGNQDAVGRLQAPLIARETAILRRAMRSTSLPAPEAPRARRRM